MIFSFSTYIVHTLNTNKIKSDEQYKNILPFFNAVDKWSKNHYFTVLLLNGINSKTSFTTSMKNKNAYRPMVLLPNIPCLYR